MDAILIIQRMVVEHGQVEKFLEQQESITEQLTDPNQVSSPPPVIL